MNKVTAKDSDNNIANLEYAEPEIWKDIEGYNGDYQISNRGRVKSLKCNSGSKESPPYILKDKKDHGYRRIALYKNNNPKFYRIARLVAMHFVSNPKNKSQVNHINGDKTDDRAINLEWTTPKENTRHAHNMGLVDSAIGENASGSKLTSKQVVNIKKLLKQGVTQKEIAKKYPVTQVSIHKIKHGKTWTHIK